MGEIKVAGVQMDIRLGELKANLDRVCEYSKTAAAAGARLVVFPECTLSGYCLRDIEEARANSIDVEGPEIGTLIHLCRELKLFVVVGLLERDATRVHNTVVCVGPQGVVSRYRKIHLPYLGVDRFTTPGNRLEVFEAGSIKVGMNICYDCAFPEASRVLMLQGADLLVLPTNWPITSGRTADIIPLARAMENNVYFMAINRVGEERGFTFIGKSKIVDPRGGELAAADGMEETILYATIDPAVARQKRLVLIPGEHEIDRLLDRRPAVYQPLTKTQLES